MLRTHIFLSLSPSLYVSIYLSLFLSIYLSIYALRRPFCTSYFLFLYQPLSSINLSSPISRGNFNASIRFFSLCSCSACRTFTANIEINAETQLPATFIPPIVCFLPSSLSSDLEWKLPLSMQRHHQITSCFYPTI